MSHDTRSVGIALLASMVIVGIAAHLPYIFGFGW